MYVLRETERWIGRFKSLYVQIRHFFLFLVCSLVETLHYFAPPYLNQADPSGRAVSGVCVRPFACWDCGFEFRGRHGCLSLENVVCCQVEVSAADQPLLRRSPTECGVSQCDLVKWKVRKPRPTRVVEPQKKTLFNLLVYSLLQK
jgi:hypothetical protein